MMTFALDAVLGLLIIGLVLLLWGFTWVRGRGDNFDPDTLLGIGDQFFVVVIFVGAVMTLVTLGIVLLEGILALS